MSTHGFYKYCFLSILRFLPKFRHCCFVDDDTVIDDRYVNPLYNQLNNLRVCIINRVFLQEANLSCGSKSNVTRTWPCKYIVECISINACVY